MKFTIASAKIVEGKSCSYFYFLLQSPTGELNYALPTAFYTAFCRKVKAKPRNREDDKSLRRFKGKQLDGEIIIREFKGKQYKTVDWQKF